AALQRGPGPLDTTSDEDIDEQFAVNFRGHWTAMVAAAALMRRDGGGAIVNTSSIGSRRANPVLPAYGAMKRALNSITETAAVTWAGDGIRGHGITPRGPRAPRRPPGQRHHARRHPHRDDAGVGVDQPRHHRGQQRGDPAGPHG